jgi:hypothetical protein
MRSPEEGSMPVTCLPGSHHRHSTGPVVLMNVNLVVAREWFGELLEKWSNAVRPSQAVTPGPPMGSWSDQWERVEIGLGRIEAIYAGRSEPEGTKGAAYDVFTFFVNCHHLKDWIKQDSTLDPSTRKKAERFVQKSKELKMCADLANRTKHSALTSTRTGDLSTGPSGNDVTVMVGTQEAQHAFRVSSGGVERDALELAHACVDRWRSFPDLNLP